MKSTKKQKNEKAQKNTNSKTTKKVKNEKAQKHFSFTLKILNIFAVGHYSYKSLYSLALLKLYHYYNFFQIIYQNHTAKTMRLPLVCQ